MIKLSQVWYYAIHAVIYVAQNQKGLVRIKDIAVKEKISESLLRRIVANLEKWKILKTVRWRNGGIQLSKPENQISVYDILEAVGEELWLRDCTKGLFCSNKKDCSTTDVFMHLQKGFNSLLKLNTLDKLLKK